jgi:hypothetical protein
MAEYPALLIGQGNAQNFLVGAQTGANVRQRMDTFAREQAAAARQAQYQNLLGEYLGGEYAGDPRVLNALYQMDPEQTNKLVEFRREEQEFDQEQAQRAAQEIVQRMEFVLQSESPSRALRLASRFSDGSDMIEYLASEGLIDPEDGIDDDEARQIAQYLIMQNQPLLPPGREDTLARKLDTVQGAIGRPLTEEEVFRLAGGSGTTINIGDKLAEPIPVAQLANVRLPDGSTPPIGTTFQEARQMGAQVVAPDERQRAVQARSAMQILEEIKDLATGEGGVLRDVEPGFQNRAWAALQFALNKATQNDPNAARYEDLTKSSLAPFIKFLGESGALSEGDVQRALGLLPRLFPLPDTREVAEQKLAQLGSLIESGVRNLNRVEAGEIAPVTSEVPDPSAMSDDDLRRALGL